MTFKEAKEKYIELTRFPKFGQTGLLKSAKILAEIKTLKSKTSVSYLESMFIHEIEKLIKKNYEK